jgi:hypothetical protein
MMRFLFIPGIHPWYIVAIVEADLGKVNCKKRIVLPWANAVGQKD